MSDYVFIRKSRNAISSLLHFILNLALGVGSILLTILTESWIPGLVLVVLSKWRTFAVRPHYWLINLKSNLVDFIVGSSFIFMTYCAGTKLSILHIILILGYVSWLIFLKPWSSTNAAKVQAFTSILVGTIAITLMSASANSVFILLGSFIIGYGASRHVLIQSDSQDSDFISLLAGLLLAEVAWLCRSWLIVYMFGKSGIIIPQFSIIAMILAFCLSHIYKNILRRDGKFKFADSALPVIFSIILIVIIIIWFSNPIFNV